MHLYTLRVPRPDPLLHSHAPVDTTTLPHVQCLKHARHPAYHAAWQRVSRTNRTLSLMAPVDHWILAWALSMFMGWDKGDNNSPRRRNVTRSRLEAPDGAVELQQMDK